MKSPDRLDALVWALSELMLDLSFESGSVKYA
jgi:phage terminase large subunit-like protein